MHMLTKLDQTPRATMKNVEPAAVRVHAQLVQSDMNYRAGIES